MSSSYDKVSQVLKADGRVITAVAYTEERGDALRVAVCWRSPDKRPKGADMVGLLDALEAGVGRDVNLMDLETCEAKQRRRILNEGTVLFDLPPGKLQSMKAKGVLDKFDSDFAALLSDPRVTGRRRK